MKSWRVMKKVPAIVMGRPATASRSLAWACLLCFSASCIPALTQNEPREPNKAVPTGYAASNAPPDAIAQGGDTSTNAAQRNWSEFFADPELKALIDAALKNNQELNIRLQETIIARTEIMSRQGDYLPRLGARAGAGIDKVGKYTSQGISDEAHRVPKNLQNYNFGFAASWEVDIWKRLRNAAQSAKNRYLASLEGRNFLITQLVADIAGSYYELLALDSRLEVLHRNIAIQQNALEIVKMQKEAARVTQLAVQRFEAEVLKNQSRQYDLEQQRIEAENRINFLLGRYPQSVPRNPQSFEAPLPSFVQSGLPSQLLENRPDVRQAELQLSAAKLDVKSARASFYPSLSIDAAVGYEAFNVKHLVTTPESLLYNLAGNLTAPLLNRRAIKALYFSANARQLQAVYNYERTLLQAYTEVVNNLAMIKNLEKRSQLQAQQVDVLVQSVDVSNVLFQSARADYMEVLLTRRDSLDAQMDLIETKNRQKQAMVNIYQALGGGWR
ncbi:MAG: efflux system, outer rane lipoprotein NodT family [Myxococcaceae bacterium]|nr:efflux system, outer rane lipoprotein NodT family [Myxococcaceae bacterium]